MKELRLIPVTKLGNDKLVELLKNNDELRREISNAYMEDEMDYIGEILQSFDGLIDYSVGFYNNNYIDIDVSIIHVGIDRVQKWYGFFSEDNYNKLKELISLYNKEITLEEFSNKTKIQSEYLNDYFIVESIEEIILQRINQITTIKEEYVIEYFISNYMELVDNYYIEKGSEDYKVFKKTIDILQ